MAEAGDQPADDKEDVVGFELDGEEDGDGVGGPGADLAGVGEVEFGRSRCRCEKRLVKSANLQDKVSLVNPA
ncbi:MAG TPA: hypothetical protein VNZ22_13725, partial [Bacillota bacterium]|nr:hypothetical protein [Bacillota bacterium]